MRKLTNDVNTGVTSRTWDVRTNDELSAQAPKNADVTQRDRDRPIPEKDVDPREVSKARQVQGLVDNNEGPAGTGAKQIAHNLDVVSDVTGDNRAKKLGAGITGMLVALMLTFTNVAPAHAQDTLNLKIPTTATSYLPNHTGPPAFTDSTRDLGLETLNGSGKSSVFATQLASIKKEEATNVDAGVQRALDAFSLAMSRALRTDAYGMALGGPVDQSRMSDAEQDAVKKALTNLLREMPVGALAPELTEDLKGVLRSRGVSTNNLEAMRLKDLGGPGGDLIKAMLNDLKGDKPAVFYGVAAVLAGAVGTLGYTQGTDAIGIRPEFKTRFFNDQLVTKVRAEWGAKFADPILTARAEYNSNVTLGGMPYATSVGLGVIAQGPTFKDISVSGLELSGSISGITKDGTYLGLSGNAVGNQTGLQHVTVSGALLKDKWTAGMGVTYFAQEERTVSSLSVGYKPQKDIEWALVGQTDTKGNNTIGVGFKMALP